MRSIRWIAVPALCALATSATAATCPPSSYQFSDYPVLITAPYTSQSYNYDDGYGDTGTSGIDFNIPNAGLDAQVTSYGYATSTAMVDVVDDFTVAGLPPGTPVSLVVHLRLDGDGMNSTMGTASVSGSIQDGMGHESHSTGITFHGTLDLPLNEVAGTPFRLTISVQANCYLNASTTMIGHFSFSGLPAGSGVVSCEGFVSDPSVPAHATSWGKIKAIYH